MSDFYLDFEGQRTEVAVQLDIIPDLGGLVSTRLRDQTQQQAVLITDERVGAIYGPVLVESLRGAGFDTLEYRIQPGETSKSLAVAGELYRFLAHHDVARDSVIVALGGGVVSDLAGFVAATWMRGVRFVVCPTTLEADVDASIGGKTGINIPGGKNLVGAFHQPILVAIDPGCLQTLDVRDVRAGLAESIKHALISSDEFLAWHEAHADQILALVQPRLTELIGRNITIKAGIVQQDAQERTGLRELLNFGHTIGHAVEECCGYTLRHGECVSLGILAACRLSSARGMIDSASVARVETLLARFSLPTKLPERIETDRVIDTIRKDKKVREGSARFVLLEAIGQPTVRGDVPVNLVREAYESLLP